jgi:hypothetical protein
MARILAAAPTDTLPGMAPPDLDAWLPDPAVRTFHRRVARADPDGLWEAAGSVRLSECRILGRLVRWRIPDEPAEVTFREVLCADPFTVLEQGQRCSLSGLVGRIWTLRRDYPRLSGAEAFRAWAEPGTAKVLFAHWVEDAGHGRAAIVSEVRVGALDRQARLGLRIVRPLIASFEALIGSEALALAARRAGGDA